MRIIDLGVTDFLEAYRFQIDLVKEVSQGISENTLLITEHEPVITLGRAAKGSNILKSEGFLNSRGIRLFNIDRGGDVTYHGPGQLIAYPVFRLENESRDIHRFLHYLEEIGIDFLGRYGLTGETRPGFRGVWIQGRKIGSIGIGIKRWTTYHGLAININVDLGPFSFIKPCGIKGIEMITLEGMLNRKLDIDSAKHRLISSFRKVPLLVEAVSKN